MTYNTFFIRCVPSYRVDPMGHFVRIAGALGDKTRLVSRDLALPRCPCRINGDVADV